MTLPHSSNFTKARCLWKAIALHLFMEKWRRSEPQRKKCQSKPHSLTETDF